MRKTDGDFSNGKAPGLDNLLYSADADFSCFAVRFPLTIPYPGAMVALVCVCLYTLIDTSIYAHCRVPPQIPPNPTKPGPGPDLPRRVLQAG